MTIENIPSTIIAGSTVSPQTSKDHKRRNLLQSVLAIVPRTKKHIKDLFLQSFKKRRKREEIPNREGGGLEGGEKKSINLDTIGGDQSYNQLYDNQKREERRNFPFTDVNSICAKKEGYKEENICLKPFTLLVHGIKDGNSMESMTQKVAMMQAEIFDPKKNINLMQDPNKICEKELISCSLIDENHMGTRSDCGFVLEANVDLIRNAGFSDLGTDFMGLGKTIKQEEEKYGLNYSPQEILDKTPPDSYNEIVLYGKKKEQTAKIQGIFIKVDERGYPIDWKKSKIDTDGQTRDIMTGKPPLSDQIYRLAYNMKLPVIFLYDKNHHLNQKNHSTHHSF